MTTELICISRLSNHSGIYCGTNLLPHRSSRIRPTECVNIAHGVQLSKHIRIGLLTSVLIYYLFSTLDTRNRH